jgi:hypothetical protein
VVVVIASDATGGAIINPGSRATSRRNARPVSLAGARTSTVEKPSGKSSRFRIASMSAVCDPTAVGFARERIELAHGDGEEIEEWIAGRN